MLVPRLTVAMGGCWTKQLILLDNTVYSVVEDTTSFSGRYYSLSKPAAITFFSSDQSFTNVSYALMRVRWMRACSAWACLGLRRTMLRVELCAKAGTVGLSKFFNMKESLDSSVPLPVASGSISYRKGGDYDLERSVILLEILSSVAGAGTASSSLPIPS